MSSIGYPHSIPSFSTLNLAQSLSWISFKNKWKYFFLYFFTNILYYKHWKRRRLHLSLVQEPVSSIGYPHSIPSFSTLNLAQSLSWISFKNKWKYFFLYFFTNILYYKHWKRRRLHLSLVQEPVSSIGYPHSIPSFSTLNLAQSLSWISFKNKWKYFFLYFFTNILYYKHWKRRRLHLSLVQEPVSSIGYPHSIPSFSTLNLAQSLSWISFKNKWKYFFLIFFYK